MNTRLFSTRTILSVTTGRLLTKGEGTRDNGIGDMYRLLEWMVGESPWTLSLGLFADKCKPYLLRQFPELKQAERLDGQLDVLAKEHGMDDGIERWLLSLGLPQSYEVPRIADLPPLEDAEFDRVRRRFTVPS